MQLTNLAILAAATAATVNAASNFTSTSIYVEAVISPVSALADVTSTSQGSQVTSGSGSGSDSDSSSDSNSGSSGSGSGSSGSGSGSGSGSSGSGSGSSGSGSGSSGSDSDSSDGGELSLSSMGKAPSFSTSIVVVSHQTTELITITSCEEHICTEVPTLTTYYSSSSYTSYEEASPTSSTSATVQESLSEIPPSVTINENSAANILPGDFSFMNAGTAALSIIALVWIL